MKIKDQEIIIVMSHKLVFLSCLIIGAINFFTACSQKDTKDADTPVYTQRLKGDSAIYGLACDGCNDTVVVVLPENNGDPVTYNIMDAKRKRQIMGKIQIGDRLCIVLNKKDKSKADLVIDIDKLAGIWCYIVMPQLRTAEELSARAQARMMNNMSDSIKETYIIPREYGFYLKHDWIAQSVGYVDDNNALAQESPVVYPPLGYFTAWHLWNGKLVITRGTRSISKNGQIKVKKPQNDTCSIDYLKGDSLVLSSDGIARSYYRKDNINDVNRKAQAIANKLKEKALKETMN